MTGRRAATVRLARGFQRLPLSWLRPLESLALHGLRPNADAPHAIFLLAVPRSGSTLTYQALVHALQPVYLSNFWNLLYALPWVGGRLSGRWCSEHRSEFRSSQGFVDGLCGPSEGLRFWSHWTGAGLDERHPPNVPEASQGRRITYLRRVLADLTDAESPFATAYLGHVLIAAQLRRWFPEALFVRVRRDPLSNAMSILRCRQAGSGGWFSACPAECSEVIGTGIHAEVASQVYWLNRRLDALDADGRLLTVDYESLCDDPNKTMNRLVHCANALGMNLQMRQALPATFPCRRVTHEEDADSLALRRELDRLEEVHGPLGRVRGADAEQAQ